jgi:hypothetical protein
MDTGPADGTGNRRSPGQRFARLNVTVPVELLEAVRADNPGLNISAVVTAALSGRVKCWHDNAAVCRDCGAVVRLTEIGDGRLAKFWEDVWWDVLTEGVRRDLTPSGIALMAKERAVRHHVPGAKELPLPRLSRSEEARLGHTERPQVVTPPSRSRRPEPAPAIKEKRSA